MKRRNRFRYLDRLALKYAREGSQDDINDFMDGKLRDLVFRS